MHRGRLSRLAHEATVRLRATERPFVVPQPPDVYGLLELLTRDIEARRVDCVRAIHFVHDAEEFVAEVGKPLEAGYGHDYSPQPVLAILRGEAFRIWTLDHNLHFGGEIVAGRPREVFDFSPDRSAEGPSQRRQGQP